MRKAILYTPHLALAVLIAISPALVSAPVSAAPLSGKSVVIGDSTPSATTNHNYRFTLASVGNVGSIEFKYCLNSPFPTDICMPVPGFSADGAVLQQQSGETGFTISPLTDEGRLILTRAPVAASAIPVNYRFANMINPSAQRSTVYVRIATYASSDATGPLTDEGALAFATTAPVQVEGYVPPYLTFCVGVIVALNCTNTVGRLLDFGELVPSGPRYLSSQFAVATNDPFGYATTVSGPTMTSGNNVIPAMGSPAFSQPGTSQFGMNLRANSNPAIGAEPIGVGSGAIAPSYGTPNRFYFRNQVIASSSVSSDFNAYTVSYMVNVSRNQQPGVYATTLTYIASASF